MIAVGLTSPTRIRRDHLYFLAVPSSFIAEIVCWLLLTCSMSLSQIRYLQVGGDWWNKCVDGWLNADFVYTR